MRWLAQTIVVVVLSACSTPSPVHTSTPAPVLPFGEFIDQVLEPLSTKLADERIEAGKAEVRSGKVSSGLLALLGSAFGPGGAAIGGGLGALQNSSIDQRQAYLDTLKFPLKKEMLAVYVSRVKEADGIYSVCVEKVERRYNGHGERFLRLADGPGPCLTTPLKTLQAAQELK